MHIEHVLQDYISNQTNYAVLISGNWGAGKTFYIKHKLFSQIENIEKAQSGRHFQPIHVSLFGIDSIEELQKQMFLEAFPITQDKVFTYPAKFLKATFRAFLTFESLGSINIDDYIKDLKIPPEDFLNFDRMVFFFDDLERKGKNLDYATLLGFMNNLVENLDAKVILVSNENKIKDVKYRELKEKLVGLVYEFSPEFESIKDEIIKTRYHEDSAYIDFLNGIPDVLDDMTDHYEGNLRTLIFSLDTLHSIFTKLFDEITNPESLINQKLENIVKFILVISIEFRNGNISNRFSDLDNVNNYFEDLPWTEITNHSDSTRGNESTTDKNKSYRQLFREKYYNGSYDEFRLYKSVYHFITGRTPIDPEKLIKEIKEVYHISNGEVLPQYHLLKRLQYFDCFKLSDAEYSQLTSEMIDFAKNGDYAFGNYYKIFEYAVRFDNILSLDLEIIERKILSGVKKAKIKQEYIYRLEENINIFPRPEYGTGSLKAIREAEIRANNVLGSVLEGERLKETLELIYIKQWNKITKLISDEYRYTPIFHLASAYKVFLALNGSSHQEIFDFSTAFANRYEDGRLERLKIEREFLSDFIKRIDPEKKIRQKKTLKNQLLRKMYDRLKNAVDKMNL